ncbi:MAG TPA: tetratricopeptide repeat protein [Candidatus Angelobacter sp.]
MNTHARLATVVAVAAALLGTAGCNKLKARDELNKGVQAYKNANYEQAIEHFKDASRLDENLKVAKLYLATAYRSQYVPGVDAPDNLSMAQQALDGYREILEKDPQEMRALQGTAWLYMQMKKWDQAREYYQRAIKVEPNDPDLYYSIGFIDWSQAYEDAATVKAKAGMKVEDEMKGKPDQKICAELRAKDGAAVEEGLSNLQTAIDKRQDYDDAMAYMNLLLRRKANDMTCDDPQARAEYVKTANDWSDRAMAARKKKAEEAAKKNQQNGIVLDTPTPTPAPAASK